MNVFDLYGSINLKGVDKVKGQLDGIKGQFKGTGDKMKSWGTGMTKAGGVVTGVVGAIAVPAVKMAIDFESAFAGVRKTVDASDEELLKIDTDLRNMTKELPVTYVELARIAEAAGQLGIKSENILSFTETIAKLGMASNITGEEGATSLARFMNITGMAKEDIGKLGSVIVDLGNNSATTEAEIVDMAMRLAAAGTTIGMSETEIIALSASLSSMGLRSEAGGTAFSRVMLEMNSAVASGGEELETFAQAAGMTTENFKKQFEEDGSGAVMSFISGLGDMKEQGKDVTPVLDELGLGGIRTTDALLRASGATDMVTESQERAAKAWEDNNALNEEVAKRQETTAAKMALLKNQMLLMAETIGVTLVPVLEDIVNAVMPIIEKIIDWVKENPKLTKTILVILGAVGGLLLTLGPILMVLGTLIPMLPVLGGAFMALMGPVGLIILGIMAVIAIGVLVVKNWDWIKEKAAAIWDGIKNILGGIGEGIKWAFENMTPIGFIIDNWEMISKMATKIFGGVVDFFKSIPTKIKSAFSSLADIMLAPFRLYVKGLESAINWIISQINKINIKVPDWVPGIGGKGWGGFNIPTISLPHFAEGGIVTGPTLAMVGESGPEMITPLSGAGGAGIVNNFNIAEMTVRDDSDIGKIARELYDLQQRSARRLGYT